MGATPLGWWHERRVVPSPPVGRLERWFRQRLVAGADLLAQVELNVSRDDVLAPMAAVSQEWHATGDLRAWLEPFIVVAYATKQVTNFRGETALGVWLSMTGQAGGTIDYRLVDSVADVGGVYAAQVFQKRGQTPFIQTPASGGSRKFRDLEVAGTARALMNAVRRNGPDSARRVEAALQVMTAMGELLGEAPSVRSANHVTSSVMRVLEDRGVVPSVGVGAA